MDILYTSLSKSNLIINEDAGGGGGGGAGTSEDNNNQQSTTQQATSTNGRASNAKTSTPFNDKQKNVNTTSLNFPSPQNYSSINDSSLQQQQNLRQRISTTTHRIIINDNQKLDAEIRMKENYLKHLKSIDLTKYSFPNENKPKTDYTYAHTGIYISHKKDDNTPVEIPNLCRRARKTPPNSFLSSDSMSELKNGSRFNLLNSIYSYFYGNKAKTISKSTNVSIINDQSAPVSPLSNNSDLIKKSVSQYSINSNKNKTESNNYYLMKNLYGLDSDADNKTISNSVVSSTSTTTTTNGVQIGTKASENSKKKNKLTHQIDKSASTTPMVPLVDSTTSPITLNNNSSLNMINGTKESKRSSKLFKWCCLFPLLLLTLLALIMLPFANKDNIIDYLHLTKIASTNLSTNATYNIEYIRNEILQNINVFRDRLLTDALEIFRSQLPDIDKIKNDLITQLNDRLNATLAILFSQLANQAVQLETAKTSCDNELKQIKEVINELQNKFILLAEATAKASARIESSSSTNNNNNVSFSKEISDEIQFKIEDIIKRSLYIYNADKTGMTDFASESLGANIMFTRCTETYTEKSRWLTVLNYPLFQINSSPRIIIQNSIQPGNCWAFKGSKGDVFIKLAAVIKPTSFSVEHIPKELSPTNSLDTAPQNFTVYGYTNSEQIDSEEGFLLGSYRYDNTSNEIIQFFNVQNEYNKEVSIVELKIESNGGNKDYTCVYKFRVHGVMVSKRTD